jgi:uncharacterized membrane protein YphA (DoxX/SURF4 family)
MLIDKKLIEEKINALQIYAIPALRISMALVFLYFGISQLIRPETFIGWLPSEMSMIPIDSRIIVIFNGMFETFFGTLLLLGLYSRTSAFLLGAHLFGITLTIGFTEIGVRDFGLAMATLALIIMPKSEFSLDYVFFKPEF